MLRATVLVGVLLLPTACGGDDEAAYCDALAKKQTIFADDGSGQGLLPKYDDLAALAKKAPDDLTDEWQVFLGAVRDLRTAISDAGVQPQDIVGGKKPDGLADDKWKAIQSAASTLSSDAVANALGGIDQQAKDVCKLQLGL